MIRTVQTFKTDSAEAVSELREKLGDARPRLLLCFASTSQQCKELVKGLQAAYPGVVLWGGTTAGELCSGNMSKGSVSVMAIDGAVVEKAALAVVSDLKRNRNLEPAFAALAKQLGSPLEVLDPEHHVGLILTDGLSGAEEQLIEAIAARTEMPFLGGSAGDDLKFQSTQVFHNGSVSSDAAVLLVLRLPRGYEVIKTQSFRETGKFLEATSVDSAKRAILTLDGRPAAYAYAEAVGAAPEAISERFAANPVARIVGSEPYIRSPRKIEGTELYLYCSVNKGERLAVMQATDIISDTRAALEPAMSSLEGIRGIVDFHCILRSLELQSRHQTQAYMDLFKEIPVAGFCTYGEACSTHVNQTSTMLVFR